MLNHVYLWNIPSQSKNILQYKWIYWYPERIHGIQHYKKGDRALADHHSLAHSSSVSQTTGRSPSTWTPATSSTPSAGEIPKPGKEIWTNFDQKQQRFELLMTRLFHLQPSRSRLARLPRQPWNQHWSPASPSRRGRLGIWIKCCVAKKNYFATYMLPLQRPGPP